MNISARGHRIKERSAPFESARLPGQRCGDGLRALVADSVLTQVEVGQRGAEKTVMKRAATQCPLVLSSCASDEGADRTIRKRALTWAMLQR